MSKFVVMSSSDSEKTASNPLHISKNAQSSSSSSPSNSNIIVDLETTGTSRENPVDIVDISKKGKQGRLRVSWEERGFQEGRPPPNEGILT